MSKRYIIMMIAVLCVLLLLCGCAKPIDYAITNDSIFLSSDRFPTYVNPDDPEDAYQAVVISGRTYLPYGVQCMTVTGEMIGECIALELGDTNHRFYKVIDSEDFIAEYYVIGVMEQFSFLRAQDTIGRNIDIPEFIGSLNYSIWN